ncbi:MFS transporter [Rhodococcus sp. HM1]|uniref:MFS transporter n=1 Tax=Rhodococcus sp. HM1 TaxID=2937759 RepID=UPI00200B69F5|nr:MFS transporter [Rhodococcus sp. HM1]MCK8670003.1 MFS transporter [Rhodococcus sp. HM1]
MDTDEPTRRDTSANTPEPAEPADWLPLVLVCVTGLIVVFNATVLSTAIGRVVADLGATVSQVQLAIVAYALMVTAFTVTGGKISRLLGPARTQLLGLGVYAVGMLVGFTAVTPRMLIAGETVAGLVGALLIPNALAILGQAYSGARRTFAVSVQAGTAGIAAALALLVGGALVQTWGWRAPFLLLLIALAVALLIALRTHLPSSDATGRLDVPSIALSATGVLLLVIGINQAGEWGLLVARDAAPLSLAGISPVPLLLVLGVLALHAFLSRQRRLSGSGRAPLLDPAVLSTPTARACLIGLLAINLLMAGTSYLLPLYTQIVLGKSPLSSAIMILPVSIAALLSAMSTPVLMRRLPPRTLLIAAHLVSACGAALLALTVSNPWTGVWTLVAEILVGLGLGAGLSAGSATLMESAPPELSGEVGSARGVADFLGISAGTAISGAILLTTLAQAAAALVTKNPELGRLTVLDLTPSSVGFVDNDDLAVRLGELGFDSADIGGAVEVNIEARLVALRAALFTLAVLTLAPIVAFRNLPSRIVRHGEARPTTTE